MAAIPDDVFFATITELGTGRLRTGEFSPAELTRAFCDRLERLGPRYNALALSLRKQAMHTVRDFKGDFTHDRGRGPLHSIPFGVKDLLAVKGHPTTWGAKPYAGQVFDEDAHVIQKLSGARAVLIGKKLAMVELSRRRRVSIRFGFAHGAGSQSVGSFLCWTGGSSSGPGAAVAAGLVPFALGSETSGSILTPSAFCGITGLRPTYGLVSRRGAMALSWTLDKIGPMCRSADDCGIVLQAISGGDSEDPGSAGHGFTHVPQFSRKPQDITVGYAPVDFAEWSDPAARPGFQAAFEVVKSLGVPLREVEIPDFPYGALTSSIIGAEARFDP